MFFVVAFHTLGFPMPVGTTHETADAAWQAFPDAERKRSSQSYATHSSEITHYAIVQIVEEIHQTAPPKFARTPYLSIAAPTGDAP